MKNKQQMGEDKEQKKISIINGFGNFGINTNNDIIEKAKQAFENDGIIEEVDEGESILFSVIQSIKKQYGTVKDSVLLERLPHQMGIEINKAINNYKDKITLLLENKKEYEKIQQKVPDHDTIENAKKIQQEVEKRYKELEDANKELIVNIANEKNNNQKLLEKIQHFENIILENQQAINERENTIETLKNQINQQNKQIDEIQKEMDKKSIEIHNIEEEYKKQISILKEKAEQESLNIQHEKKNLEQEFNKIKIENKNLFSDFQNLNQELDKSKKNILDIHNKNSKLIIVIIAETALLIGGIISMFFNKL